MTCAIADAGRVRHLGGHSLLDEFGIGVNQIYNPVVVGGVPVVLAVALYHSEGSQIHLHGFYDFVANPRRQYEGFGF